MANMLKSNVLWNFRKTDGEFPTDLRCSNCNCSAEVFIEIFKSSPILRLCKGCLTKYINDIDVTYQKHMSKGGN